MVFRFNAEVLEDRIRPESFHKILSLSAYHQSLDCNKLVPNFQPGHAVRDNVSRSLLGISFLASLTMLASQSVPGPAAALSASSPMKKSRSSVPLFACREPPEPAPPVRKDGLLATAGRPEPEPPPAPPTPPFVAIAVGKTKEGESLPANPEHC